MKSADARAARKERIMAHAQGLIDRAWPMPPPDAAAKFDAAKSALAAELDAWVAYAEGKRARPSGNLSAIYTTCSRAALTGTHAARRAAATESFRHIIADYRPRTEPNGIRIKLPEFTLTDRSLSVTLSNLWAHIYLDGTWNISVSPDSNSSIPEHRGGSCHPHVLRGLPCMGSLKIPYCNALQQGYLSSALDYLVDALDIGYNDASPYVSLGHFIGQTCRCGKVMRELLNARDESGAAVRLCDQCLSQCRECGVAFVRPPGHPESLARCCQRCSATCIVCGARVPRTQLLSGLGCRHCTRECGNCGYRRKASAGWYINPGLSYYCETCVNAPNPRYRRFDMAALLRGRPSGSTAFSRDELTEAWNSGEPMPIPTPTEEAHVAT